MSTLAKLLGTLLLAAFLVPLPARAADADVAVTMGNLTDTALIGRNDPNAGKITPTQTKRHVVTLTNLGPSTALKVDVQKPTLDAHLDHIADVTGCVLKSFTCGAGDPSSKCTAANLGKTVIDPNDARSWPCTVPSISDVPGSNVVKVNIDVSWPGTPDDKTTPQREDIPATCPDTITLGADSVTVTTSGTTDPNTGNNSDTKTPLSASQAFLKLTLAADRGSASPGDRINVTGSVENLGPCPAADVWVVDWDGTSDQKRTWVDGSTTGCVDNAVDWADTNGAGCEIGTIAVGETKPFTASYIVGPLANDEMQRAITINAQTYSGFFPYYFPANGMDPNATLDPDETDNGKSVNVISSHSVSSCSTGGIPGVLGLVLLAMPLIRRRRTR